MESDVLDLGVPTSLVFTRDESTSLSSAGSGLSESQKETLAALLDSGEDDLSSTAWLRESGMSDSTFYAARKALIGGGFVDIVKVGNRSRYRVTDKGREAVDPTGKGATDDAA
jgi:predicted transcriptional regulator